MKIRKTLLINLIILCSLIHATYADEKEYLRILSFNTWLLEYAGKDLAVDIDERLALIPSKLAETGADIIFLQEVWTSRFRNILIQEMKKHYYDAFFVDVSNFFSLGNGLLIFSKYPIVSEGRSKNFSVRTRFDERFVKKGAIKTMVEHPEFGRLELYNFHLGAMSFDFKKGMYKTKHFEKHQLQLIELVEFIEKTRSEDAIQIIAGDLNKSEFKPSCTSNGNPLEISSTYSYFVETLLLYDSYRYVHQDPNSDSYDGYTYSANNPYSKAYINSDFLVDIRIDFIFASKYSGLLPVSSQIVFQESSYENGAWQVKNLSDHFAVLSSFVKSE